MTNKYALLSFTVLGLFFTKATFAQDFNSDFEPIRNELKAWDPVRGEWLANSLVSMSRNEQVPDRMFPDDLTPVEMLRSLPDETRARVSNLANDRAASNAQSQQWRRISSAVERVNCSPVSGRSYGDPHLASFDGVTNSFQTVGEFVLVESESGNMAVHVRQRNTSDEISVTNAIAMNVAGDRVAIYGEDTPDGNRTTPLRVNGEAVYMENDSYYLANGGVIRADGGKRLNPSSYTIVWPTGETVKVSGRNQMNIVVQVYPCTDRYQGILGNANGNRADDYNTRGTGSVFGGFGGVDFGDARMNDQMQKEYLAFMSKDFAMSWRITQQESLFDYAFNQNTMTFTDYSYPRVHRTVNDMAQSDRDRARRECERAGIRGADLNACIYDVGFARIDPSPRPVIPDVSAGRVYKPVDRPTPNVNPGGVIPPRRAIERTEGKSNATLEGAPVTGGAQPISTANDGGVSNGRKEPVRKEMNGEPAEPAIAPVTTDKPATETVKPVKTHVSQEATLGSAPVKPAKNTEPAVEPAAKPVFEPTVEPETPKRTIGTVIRGNSSPASSPELASPKPAPARTQPVKIESAPKPSPAKSTPTISGPMKVGRR